MIGVLTDILHGILDIPFLIVNLLVESINGWILILAVFIKGLVALLPGFPDLPTFPEDTTAAVAWLLPVAGLLAVFSALVALWLIVMGVKVALNWGKVNV